MCIRGKYALKIIRPATLKQKLQIELVDSHGQSLLTLDQPAPALTIKRQAPGNAATRVAMLTSHGHGKWVPSPCLLLSSWRASPLGKKCNTRPHHWANSTAQGLTTREKVQHKASPLGKSATQGFTTREKVQHKASPLGQQYSTRPHH